jgi:hypothetical protein
MWRTFLISFGLLAMTLTGCDASRQMARTDSGNYEVMALVAE